MERSRFNDDWYFSKFGAEGDAIQVSLPHDAQILEPRAAELPMDSGYFPGGKYVYTKRWHCPKEYAGKALYLEFDGVYMNAEVSLNGQRLAFQPYGYTNFRVPLQGHVVAGGENEIRVVADNSRFPNARWYTGAGIYRDVFLHVGQAARIPPYGVRVKTLGHSPARIGISVESACAGGCTALTDILYGGEVVASAPGFDFELEIPAAQLWDEHHPHLYQARVRLLDGDSVVDEVTETFGIRHIAWDAAQGLRINGQTVLLRGACVHHDNGILGAAAHADVEERKVRRLKEAGFNALRSSHNPCSRAMLEACDRLGMYMMDEFADVWTQHKHKHDYAGDFPEWYEKDLGAMVQRDHNHPSVILYSIGNEVSESAFPEGVEYARRMKQLVHRLDGSRPVTCGINLLLNGLAAMGKGLYNGEDSPTAAAGKEDKKASGSTFVNGIMSRMGGIINNVGRMKRFDLATRDIFAVLDIAGYNYGSGRYKVDPKKYPGRITVGSETFPPALYHNWQAVQRYPNLVGDFMWTGWDYLGEAGIGVVGYGENSGVLKAYPMLLAGSGVIEITGEFRPEVYWNQAVWGLRSAPYISVEPLTHAGEKVAYGMWRNTDGRHSWAWHGCEGRATKILVYASAHTVELVLNGKSLGRRRVKACRAVFRKVAYQPGELKAIAYDANGQSLGEDVLHSADKSLALQIVPEQQTAVNGRPLFASIALADAGGVREYGADRPVTVSVQGGTLLAMGSASPEPGGSYRENTHTTWYGAVQVVILPAADAKAVTIHATAQGLEPVRMTIETEA